MHKNEHNKKKDPKKKPIPKKKPVKKKVIKKKPKKKKTKTRAELRAAEQLRTKNSKKRMLVALESTFGIVTPALKVASVGRTQYYQWLKDDPEFKKETQTFEDISLDFSETQLVKQIQNGNIAAILFHLKTKGKKRGYIERGEFEHIIKDDVIDYSKLSDKDLNEIEAKLLKAKLK